MYYKVDLHSVRVVIIKIDARQTVMRFDIGKVTTHKMMTVDVEIWKILYYLIISKIMAKKDK